MIRELHVYGRVKEVGSSSGNSNKAQHLGIGKKLMVRAESWSYEKGAKKIAVIAGIGVRDYYRRLGYNLADTYMVKKIPLMNEMWRMMTLLLVTTILYLLIVINK
jgi:elongator complex protein 3